MARHHRRRRRRPPRHPVRPRGTIRAAPPGTSTPRRRRRDRAGTHRPAVALPTRDRHGDTGAPRPVRGLPERDSHRSGRRPGTVPSARMAARRRIPLRQRTVESLRRRPAGPRDRSGRRDGRVPPRRPRLPSGSRDLARKLGAARSDHGTGVGPRQHRRVRRGPRARDGRRAVGRSPVRRRHARNRTRTRHVLAGDRAECPTGPRLPGPRRVPASRRRVPPRTPRRPEPRRNCGPPRRTGPHGSPARARSTRRRHCFRSTAPIRFRNNNTGTT